jgi:transcriptional regulator
LYIPEHFRVRHHADAIRFMQANPFVILVSNSDEGPFASHIPVVLRESGEQLIVRGHFAKANPHWRHLQQQPQALAIFHGPHSYISPSLYTNRESVPTWNYGAVHVYGNARVFAELEHMLDVLHDLMTTFDPVYAEQWASLSPAYRERMLSHIVAFEMIATKIEAKFKLNQNRPKEDQANVMAALEKADDTAVSGVAKLMQEQGLGSSSNKK